MCVELEQYAMGFITELSAMIYIHMKKCIKVDMYVLIWKGVQAIF